MYVGNMTGRWFVALPAAEDGCNQCSCGSFVCESHDSPAPLSTALPLPPWSHDITANGHAHEPLSPPHLCACASV